MEQTIYRNLPPGVDTKKYPNYGKLQIEFGNAHFSKEGINMENILIKIQFLGEEQHSEFFRTPNSSLNEKF